jgi:hypothetical protein
VADARDLLIEWQTKQINRLENQNHELLKMFQTLSITQLGVIWALNPPPGPPAAQDPAAGESSPERLANCSLPLVPV